MKKAFWPLHLCLALLLSLTGFSASFAENPPNGLRPIDPNSKSKCLEYYIIQGKGYCKDTPPAETHPLPEMAAAHERIQFQFDERPWQMGFWNQKTTTPAFEYTLASETVYNWRELVGTQFIPKSQSAMTPAQLLNAQLSILAKQGFHPKVTIHTQSETNILYEWVLNDTPAENQDELQRIFATEKGLYVIRYVSRPTMTQAHRETWKQLLLNARAK